MIYLIANWKAAMTLRETQEWFTTFLTLYRQGHLNEKLNDHSVQIILCPPYPLLDYAKKQSSDFTSIAIGAQHTSPHKNGAYTGEVTAQILKDFVSYSIVGHSEMRTYDHMTEEEIKESLLRCQEEQLKTILCVRNTDDALYPADIVAYEPVDAIGTGNNARIEDVIAMKKKLNVPSETAFLYGGSVKPENMNEYMTSSEINGLLIGAASRNPTTFLQIIKAALS